MSVQLPSKRKEFQGFGEFYDAEAAPCLRAREEQRKRAVRAFFLILLAGTLGAAAAFVLVPAEGLNLQLAFVAFAIGLGLGGFVLRRARADISGSISSTFC